MEGERCHWGDHHFFLKCIPKAESTQARALSSVPGCDGSLTLPLGDVLAPLPSTYLDFYIFTFSGEGEPRLTLVWPGSTEVLAKHYSISLRQTWIAIVRWSL